jgi:glycosyltransferase involved in cell wall biosynthesis
MTGGGLSTYALELSEALVKRGLDAILLGVGKISSSRTLRYETLPHVKGFNIFMEPFVWNASIGASASRILQSSSVDIVHCVYPALVPFINLRKAVVCSGWFSPHNLWMRLATSIRMSSFNLSKMTELYGQAEYFLLDELGYKKSERIFAVTKTLEEGLRRRFGDKVQYLPPGIKLHTDINSKKKDKVLVACIAADLENPRKGVSYFLRALNLIEPSLLKRIEVWLIGNYAHKIENEVQMLRRRGILSIKLLGYIPRASVLEYLSHIDLLVCPSLYEEFGYVMLEAMGAGIPILATKIRPLTDIAVHGVSGFFYNKGNIRELSLLISTLVSDDVMRRKMGEEARKRILKEFNWDTISQKLENYYKEILDSFHFTDRITMGAST